NYENEVQKIEGGIHGLSNHHLDTPWPKALKGKQMRLKITSAKDMDMEALFSLLKDNDTATEEDIPDTGLSNELETQLSPLFIDTGNYGTRCSTVLVVDKEDNVEFIERTYEHGRLIDERQFAFTIR